MEAEVNSEMAYRFRVSVLILQNKELGENVCTQESFSFPLRGLHCDDSWRVCIDKQETDTGKFFSGSILGICALLVDNFFVYLFVNWNRQEKI